MTDSSTLARRLRPLVGRPFRLTGKTRTDGANVRRIVTEVLEAGPLPAPSAPGTWRPLTPKAKGLPRLLREFADTHIVASGSSYNHQVWNRNPAAHIPQVELEDGSVLHADDVRFIFVRVDTRARRVKAVVVLTPRYIERHFGKFGKPTVKEQLIISDAARTRIRHTTPPILFHPDRPAMARRMVDVADLAGTPIDAMPSPETTLTLTAIRDAVAPKLIGRKIQAAQTKTRGQHLERIVAEILGYKLREEDLLVGGYPDFLHQALEVKVQDSPTVDLGMYSPQFDEPVPDCPGFSTQDIRYLIALTNPDTLACEGVVLCPGRRLAEHFSYVAAKNFKCQRSIPMEFFDKFEGRAVFNP